MMTCRDLASRIEELQPDALPREVARLCLLLANSVEDLDDLTEDDRLCEHWRRTGLRLQSVTDQHAAMTEELASLAQDNPSELSYDELFLLFRAIKVQSRVLDLYVGQPTATA
jgi:hypothetical protein